MAGPAADSRTLERVAWLLPVAVGLLLHAGQGYRPFPSIDDFVYLPLARVASDPSSYPRDVLLHEFVLHAPVWQFLVDVFDSLRTMAFAFWVLTLLLSVATAAAVYRIARAVGVPPVLFPLVAVVALCGRVVGVGRGLYDGAFGQAFHMQWLALCLLLWCYDAVIRRRPLTAGGLLGLAALAHPVVGAHGALAAAAGGLVGPHRWGRLSRMALVAVLVAAPVGWPLLRRVVRSAAANPVSTSAVVRDGYLFRTPHEFSFVGTSVEADLLIVVIVLAGLAGILLRRREEGRAVDALRGILLAHVAFLAAAVIWHGAWLSLPWSESYILPYLLHLSRTSPLVIVLAVIAAAAGGEAAWRRTAESIVERWMLRPALVVAAATVVMLLPWRPVHLAAVAFSGVLWGAGRWKRTAGVLPAVICAVVGGIGLVWALQRDVRSAPLASEEAELYDWARTHTGAAALFIVPPGMERFRTYAERSVFADFKVFPASTPHLIPEWRRRLELISAPDRLARGKTGWEAVPYWDRSYANRNTPARIAHLLDTTGADYFVWDSAGLAVPPFTDSDHSTDERLVDAFVNQRFRVYRLARPL